MNSALQVPACQRGSAPVTGRGRSGTGISLLGGPRTEDGDGLPVNKPRQRDVPRKCRFGNSEVFCSSSVLSTYLRRGVFKASRK